VIKTKGGVVMSEIEGSNDSTDNLEIMDQVIKEKLLDAETPGFEAEFSPDEADLLGAFEETALTEKDALDSVIDQLLTKVGSLK